MGQPGYFCFDLTGVIAEGTYVAAYDAAQVALTAADILVNEKENAVFALCRPPGHHASRDLFGGYCFFNNAAIAVRYLIDVKKVGKVAILDIDYHHGNGTQDIFENCENPLFVSIHGQPDYPYYTGSSNETGKGAGLGFTRNIPLALGTRDEEYLLSLRDALSNTIQPFEPDVLVVSLGVDTYVEDNVGNFMLTSDCFIDIGRMIASVQKPTLFVMEGGYDVATLGKNVTNVLKGFQEVFPVSQDDSHGTVTKG
ncbi:acetylpolyamine aminohydrolase protein [Zopfochytrium polystomum]|nr:acetylpolyamine aminohydrolase protein [Zopfochytrium polystomum]